MKKSFIIFFIFFSAVLIKAQNINVGQLIYYPFDGNVTDLSGNNNHGTAYSLTFGADRLGNPNSAAIFNGINGYVSLPNIPSLKPQLPVSIAFWVKVDDVFAHNSEFFTNDYLQNSFSGVFVNLNPSSKKIQVSIGNAALNSTTSANRRSKTGTTVINSNVWYHVIAVVSGFNDITIYVNCQNDGGTYDGTGTSLGYTNMPGVIGVNDIVAYNPFFFKGSIDEVRYWNRALTQADIDALCGLSVDAGSDYYICVGDSVVIGGSPTVQGGTPPVTFNWSPAIGLNNANILNPIASPTQTTTYIIQAVDFFGVIKTDSVTVNVFNIPIVDLGNDTILCIGDTLYLDAGPGADSYIWSTTETSQIIAVTSSGTYSVIASNGAICSDTGSINVVFSNFSVNSSQTNVCFGMNDGSANVNVSGGIPPYSYSWNTNPPQYTSSITGLSEGPYSVIITDSIGCTKTIDFNISSNPDLLAEITYVTPTGCAEILGKMEVTASGGTPPYSYSWNTIPVQNTSIANNLSPGVYFVTVTDNNGCIVTDTAEYSVIGFSLINFPASCNENDGSATVSVNSFTGNYSILWSNGSTDSTITDLGHGVYSVTVTDDKGSCTKTFNISQIQGPKANFVMKPNPATEGEDLVYFYNRSTGETSWFWDFGDNSSSNLENPTHLYIKEGQYTVWLFVYDYLNCVDSIGKNIIIEDVFTFYVPNAFSPNNDGHNDTFQPYANIPPSKYKMSIFNRWGQLVFQTQDFYKPWDGRVLGGDATSIKPDVYSYMIEYRNNKGQDKVVYGVVTVIL